MTSSLPLDFSLENALEEMACGKGSPEEIETLLRALHQRGETHQDITTFARFLRKHAHRITLPPNTVDLCGTGGDGLKTYNISTATAFVVAGCGVPVAKHGGRSVSSQCGSLDVLEALGVPIKIVPTEANFRQCEKNIAQTGLGFLPAPLFHPVMRHMAEARKRLACPTIANLAAPLSHPGGVQFQLLGVYDQRWLEPMATSLCNLGTKHSWIVHGVAGGNGGGIDEISISGETTIMDIIETTITRRVIVPEDAGLPRHAQEDLVGGDRETNAQALMSLLKGEEDILAYKDAVLLNASGALCLVGKARTLIEGVEHARTALLKGDAYRLYHTLVKQVQREEK